MFPGVLKYKHKEGKELDSDVIKAHLKQHFNRNAKTEQFQLTTNVNNHSSLACDSYQISCESVQMSQ